MQVANVPASSSSRAPRVVSDERPAVALGNKTPLALRALIPGKGSLRGVYLKRIASSHIYQGFYPSNLKRTVICIFILYVISHFSFTPPHSSAHSDHGFEQQSLIITGLVESQLLRHNICCFSLQVVSESESRKSG